MKGGNLVKKNTLGSLIWLRIIRFTHQSNLLSNDFLKEFGLTTAQFDVLVQISIHGSLTQGELAEKVTVTQGGISRMLSRLEKEQLIVREQQWKTKTIRLTERGKEKLFSAFDDQLAFQTAFFDDCLSKKEQKILLSLMTRVQKNSEKKFLRK